MGASAAFEWSMVFPGPWAQPSLALLLGTGREIGDTA